MKEGLKSNNRVLTEFFDVATSTDYRKALSCYGLDLPVVDAFSILDGLTIYEKNDDPKGVGKIQRLDWDSKILGVDSARIGSLYFLKDDTEPYQTRLNMVEKLLYEATEGSHKFLTCRISADDIFLAHALEEKGFRLCDVLNIYLRKMGDTLSVQSNGRKEVRKEAMEILARCLDGMTWGRMYQDPCIDNKLAVKFYLETSKKILNQESHITIARDKGRGIGVAIGVVDQDISKNIGSRYGVLWLIVVDPSYQGKGFGNALLSQFIEEFSDQTDLLEIGTQVSNRSANRMYIKANCYPLTQALTFHWWQSGIENG